MAELIEEEFQITLPEPPSLNRLYRVDRKRGHKYKTKSHKEYVTYVHQICIANKIKPLKGDIGMSIVWYPSSNRRDIDSPLKTLLDSLNGFAYDDDKQIAELAIVRSDTEKHNPRVEVVLYDLFSREKLTKDES